MVQTLAQPKLVTFAEFADWKPENRFYELYNLHSAGLLGKKIFTTKE